MAMCGVILQWVKRCGLRITFSAIIALTWCGEVSADEVRVLEVITVRSAVTVIDEVGRRPADPDKPIRVGNQVEVPRFGGLSVKVVDGSLLKLGGETTFHYQHSPENVIAGTLSRGSLWYRSNEQRAEFLITTPGTEISIRGTEWVVRVSEEGVTTLAVVEGAGLVAKSSEQRQAGEGEVVLTGEVARVAGVGAPLEMVAESPLESASWVRRYRPLWVSDELNKTPLPEAPAIIEALEAFRAGDLPTLEAALVESKARLSGTREWLVLKGFLDLAVGDRRAAEKRFEQAIDVDANWPVPHANLALIALVNRELEAAESRSRTALDLGPDDLTALIVRTQVTRALLDFDSAKETAERALHQAPQWWRTRVIAADISLDTQRATRAQTLLRGVASEAVGYPEVLTISGYIALEAGSNEAALAYFAEALEGNPEHFDALIGRGVALDRLGYGEKGIAALQLAALIQPWNTVPRTFLAKTYFDMGKTYSSFIAIQKAKRADASDPLPWYVEGDLLYRLGRSGKALASLEKARLLGKARPMFSSSRLLGQVEALLAPTIAAVYLASGLRFSALQHAARALERDPLNTLAYAKLSAAAGGDPRGLQRLKFSATTMGYLLSPLADTDPKRRRHGSGRSRFDGVASVEYRSNYQKPRKVRTRMVEENLSVFARGSDHFVTGLGLVRRDKDTQYQSNTSLDSSNIYHWSTVLGRWKPSNKTVVSARVGSTTSATTRPVVGTYFLERPIQHTRLSTVAFTAASVDRDDWTHLYSLDYKPGSTRRVATSPDRIFTTIDVLNAPQWVGDSAWLRSFDDHNVRGGARFISSDYTFTSDDYVGTYNYDSGSLTSGSQLASLYLTDQFNPNPHFHLTSGVTFDLLKYEGSIGKSYSINRLNPAFGAVWQLTEQLVARAALYRQTVGDDIQGRFQPLTIGGFPWLSSKTFNMYATREQRFNMRQSALRIGLDKERADHRLFWGLEAGYYDLAFNDRDSSSARNLRRESAQRLDLQAYIETRSDSGWSAFAHFNHLTTENEASRLSFDREQGAVVMVGVRRSLPLGMTLSLDAKIERLSHDRDLCGKALVVTPALYWVTNRKTHISFGAGVTDHLGDRQTCFDSFNTFGASGVVPGNYVVFKVARSF